MLSRFVIGLLLVGLCFSCNPSQEKSKGGLLSDVPESFSGLFNSSIQVFLFMAPDCPMCQSYCGKIKALSEKYSSQGVKFTGIVSGDFYRKTELDSFVYEHGFTPELVVDKNYDLAKFFGASVVPEVFVRNKAGKILYTGLIDDATEKFGYSRKWKGKRSRGR